MNEPPLIEGARQPLVRFLERFEECHGQVPGFWKAWHSNDPELRECLQARHALVDPLTRVELDTHVRAVRRLMGSDGIRIEDVPVACTSRMDVGAVALRPPSGGHVIAVNVGFVDTLTVLNALRYRLSHDSRLRIDPRLRARIYEHILRYARVDALQSTLPAAIDDLDERILALARRDAVAQLRFALLHEYAHILSGDGEYAALARSWNSDGFHTTRRAHESEFMADRYAVDRLIREPENQRNALASQIVALLEGFRANDTARGLVEFTTETHPDPRQRADRVLRVLYPEATSARRERIAVDSTQLVWGTAAARLVETWNVTPEQVLQPDAVTGQVLLLLYAAAAWAADAIREYLARVILTAYDGFENPDLKLREGGRRSCQQLGERRDLWRRVFEQHNQGLELAVASLPCVPERLPEYDPGSEIQQVNLKYFDMIRRLSAHRRSEIVKKLASRFGGSPNPAAVEIGLLLGRARISCSEFHYLADGQQKFGNEQTIDESEVQDAGRSSLLERESLFDRVEQSVALWTEQRATADGDSEVAQFESLTRTLFKDARCECYSNGFDFGRIEEMLDDLVGLLANSPHWRRREGSVK